MEVCYLLLNGELPNKAELDTSAHDQPHTMLHEQLNSFYKGFRRDAHPMAIMCGVVGALSAFYHDSTDISDPVHRKISSHRLIAKMPTIAAAAYKYSVGQPFLYPDNSLSYTGNFLRMTFGVPAEDYEIIPAVEKAMDRIFILHADHEQNASTSTVRLAGSSAPIPSHASQRASLASGAQPMAVPTRRRSKCCVRSAVRSASRYIDRAKDKNDPFRLMGFGHRVYKNYDPRATVMQKTVREVFDALKVTDPVFETRCGSRRCAQRPYFIEKKLFPNVDFYRASSSRRSASRRRCSPRFSRSPHRRLGGAVERDDLRPGQKIGRPRQLYTGPAQRDYVAIEKR
jgi:citrate synthase